MIKKLAPIILLSLVGYWWYSSLPLTVGPAPGSASRVLILLHGHGASKSDLLPLAQELSRNLPGWHFVLPEAPERVGFGGRTWFPRTYAKTHSELAQKVTQIRADARAVVFDIIEDLIAAGLDPERIYVGGFSQGASVALDVLAFGHNGVDLGGLVSLSGGSFDVELDRLGEQLPLRAFVSHGRNDPVLPVTSSRNLVRELESYGHTVEFIEFAGGHQVPGEVVESLLQFLNIEEGSLDV